MLGGYLQCFNTILTKDTHGITSRDIHVKYLISNNGIEKIENIPVEILAAFNIREENPVLQSVKSIIGLTLEKTYTKKIKQVIYREDDLEIHYFSDDEIQRICLLSDGYRNIIGFVSDIAYRMALLNSHLNDKITNTPGILLIDEIDLHFC